MNTIRWSNAGPPTVTLAHHWTNAGSISRVFWVPCGLKSGGSDAAGCGVDGWSDHALMLTWACIGVMRQVVVSTGGLITLWCSPRLVLEWCGGLWCRRVVWSRSDAHLGLYWSDAAGCCVDGWSDHALMLTWACIGAMQRVVVSTGGLITLWCSPGLVLEWCGRLWCRRVVWSHSDAHLGLYWSDAAGCGVDGWLTPQPAASLQYKPRWASERDQTTRRHHNPQRVIWSHSDAHLGLYWSDWQVVVSTGGLITLWCSPGLVWEWCGGLGSRRVVWSRSDAHLGLYWSDAVGCGVDGWSDQAQMLTWACIGVMRRVVVSTGGLITLWCSPGLV